MSGALMVLLWLTILARTMADLLIAFCSWAWWWWCILLSNMPKSTVSEKERKRERKKSNRIIISIISKCVWVNENIVNENGRVEYRHRNFLSIVGQKKKKWLLLGSWMTTVREKSCWSITNQQSCTRYVFNLIYTPTLTTDCLSLSLSADGI